MFSTRMRQYLADILYYFLSSRTGVYVYIIKLGLYSGIHTTALYTFFPFFWMILCLKLRIYYWGLVLELFCIKFIHLAFTQVSNTFYTCMMKVILLCYTILSVYTTRVERFNIKFGLYFGVLYFIYISRFTLKKDVFKFSSCKFYWESYTRL